MPAGAARGTRMRSSSSSRVWTVWREPLYKSCSASRRSPRVLASTTWARSAISSGMESPIGEPLATLPPSVPELRTGSAANRVAKQCSWGHCAVSAANASVSVTAAPIAMCSGCCTICCNGAARVTSINCAYCRCCRVIHSPTSVAPATICAPANAARAASKSGTVVGAEGRLIERLRRQAGHLLGGVEDRAVAGAAAQVAREFLPGHFACDGPALAQVVLVQREQAHHEAGRAKAALRAMALHHGLLHGVQAGRRVAVGPDERVLGQVLHRPQRLAGDRVRQADATVHGAVVQPAAPRRAQHH